MPKTEHLFHRVSGELGDWVDTMSDAMAEGMHDGTRPPFGADEPEDKLLDYYEARLFNPDGTPNEPNRQAEIARVGPDGYARVLLALQKRRAKAFPGAPDPVQVPQEVESGY